MNLIEGLQSEMNRCRELVKLYDEIPTGAFGSAMIKAEIKNAEDAIASGDTIKMLSCYKSLQGCE